nr:MAG: major capsid protein [Microvirus sp.]
MAKPLTARGSTRPIPTMKSKRRDEWRGLTSMKAGVIVPIAYFPLLREDRARGSVMVQIKSEETLHVIVNPVRVRVECYLIPKTALPRFGGSVEVLNRSFLDEPAPSGFGTTPKWLLQDMNPVGKSDTGYPLFDALGIHYKGTAGGKFNSDLCESYNVLVNWMRAQVSQSLAPLPLDNPDFAPAFWDAVKYRHIKPSFDAAQMEGAVPVGLDGTVPVRGISAQVTKAADLTGNMQNRDGTIAAITAEVRNAVVNITDYNVNNAYGGGDTGPFVDLSVANSTISLANIALARQTQAFAALKDRYKAVPDEYLVDLLMQGISIPESQLREPVLLGRGEAVIGQTERFATDADNLDVSVSNGVAQLAMSINTPQVNTGGMILVVASVVPEQLSERQRDDYISYNVGTKEDSVTPDYLADYLDPQKVEVVTNGHVDTFHSDPSGLFGYAPLNHRWQRSFSRVGGKYKRPDPDAFVEDRQRIWSVEPVDPTLSDDWYVCPTPFPHTVFADTTADPYEVIVVGNVQMIGNTVFGPGFEESRDSFDEIMAQVDMTRLTGDIPTDEALSAKAGAKSDEVVEEAEKVEAQK